jgi:predicted dehydrogenase
MRRMYDEGLIGELVSIWSRRMNLFRRRTPDSWRSSYKLCGGFMSELLAHEIDWIVSLAGLPASVYCRIASRANDDPRANEHIWMTLAFGSATGTLEGSWMSYVPDYYRGVTGTEGGLFTQEWGNALMHARGPKDCVPVKLDPPFDKYGHFLDVIEERCASQADAAWGRTIVTIGQKALDSATSGMAVPL